MRLFAARESVCNVEDYQAKSRNSANVWLVLEGDLIVIVASLIVSLLSRLCFE